MIPELFGLNYSYNLFPRERGGQVVLLPDPLAKQGSASVVESFVCPQNFRKEAEKHLFFKMLVPEIQVKPIYLKKGVSHSRIISSGK